MPGETQGSSGSPPRANPQPPAPFVRVVVHDTALASLSAAHLHQWGLRCREAHDEARLWESVEELAEPDLVLLDVFLGPADGSRLVAELVRRLPRTPVIMVTRSSDIEIAVRSMRSGARDYILKPIDFKRLERSVRDALDWRQLQRQLGAHQPTGSESPEGPRRDDPPATGDRVDEPPAEAGDGAMIGRSPPMRRVREVLERAAPTNVPVLLLGETGTGKELAARALHAASPRRDGPFVAVNASAVPHELIESELFGHEKGAVTGAAERRIGFCERADGGTLFLDEIGEMAADVQSKLLRFLQDHEVQRVGAAAARPVDVRVVAATNVDPQSQIRAGRLREDLYYRLRGVQLELPPLRQRGDDVVLLAEHFLARASRQAGRPGLRLSPAAVDALRASPWPGNVRQLENLIREAAILTRDATIDVDDLALETPAASASEYGASHSPGLALEEEQLDEEQRRERELIAAALGAGESPEAIAKRLGKSRATLYRRLRAYGLKRQR